ncbi:hypothetical protein, partial [Streptomyces mirabilis]|uniref:hypothetical protein n=1 Tax=Streptomyces mirabilis TaxID=68239 RepID=UPI0034050A88
RSPPEMEQHHRHHNDLTSNNTLSIKELQLPCLPRLWRESRIWVCDPQHDGVAKYPPGMLR